MLLMNCLYRNLCKKSFTQHAECVRRYCHNESEKIFRQPKFSTSPAYKGGRTPTPIHLHPILSQMDVYPRSFMIFQSIVVWFSLGSLLVYSLIREENDIDEMFDLSKPLHKTIPVFEKEMLNEQITLAKLRGDPPEVILEYENRIKEIDDELKKKK